jgi:hypothetical protein
MDLLPNTTTLTLPNKAENRNLARSVAHQAHDVTPAQPLYDTLNGPDSNLPVEAAMS